MESKFIVPFKFKPSASEYEGVHLNFERVTGGQTVSWPIAGVQIFLPGDDPSPTMELLESKNPGFKAHGLSGFSIGNYHEFLVGLSAGSFIEKTHYVGMQWSGIEATFGDATPIAAWVFCPYHEDIFGEWDEISSLRIVGATIADIELVLVNACIAYQQKFGITPTTRSLYYDEISESDLEWEIKKSDRTTMSAPPMIANIEPLRFFYRGLIDPDHTGACIYYYRVIEYFSTFANIGEIKNLRHDYNLSDVEFCKRVIELATRDEKGPLFRLVTSITDDALLADAATARLTQNTAISTFCEALY